MRQKKPFGNVRRLKMKWYAKYSFRRSGNSARPSEYILDTHAGVDIPNFPTEWISIHRTHAYYSEALHPAFKEMQEAYQFIYAVSLEGIAFIGLEAILELNGFHLGYFGEDGVLLRFESHKSYDKLIINDPPVHIKKVALYFFENMKEKLSVLYHLCISGQLEIDMECEPPFPSWEPSWSLPLPPAVTSYTSPHRLGENLKLVRK